VPTAIIGAGHLGQALANYHGLQQQGFPIRGIFDINPRLQGLEIRGLPIRDLDELEPVCRREGIKIGVLTVPAGSAQDIANRLIAVGVTGILNFAPTELRVPDHVSVRHERLTVGFMALSFKVKCSAMTDLGLVTAEAEDDQPASPPLD
jgi:redox-sensing transcriptional repressor